MSGLVLQGRDLDYSDLSAFGRVTIECGPAGVEITVDGFEFEKSGSCRQHVGKALAWARDVLQTEVNAVRLVPGGHIRSATGIPQDDLVRERAAAD